MFIKGYGGSLFNAACVASIFYGSQTGNVRAEMMNGRSTVISERMTGEEGEACLEIIAREIAMGKELVICPSAEQCKGAIANKETKWHHATGKKTKRHGGS